MVQMAFNIILTKPSLMKDTIKENIVALSDFQCFCPLSLYSFLVHPHRSNVKIWKGKFDVSLRLPRERALVLKFETIPHWTCLAH